VCSAIYSRRYVYTRQQRKNAFSKAKKVIKVLVLVSGSSRHSISVVNVANRTKLFETAYSRLCMALMMLWS
jgi:hypothetical protein